MSGKDGLTGIVSTAVLAGGLAISGANLAYAQSSVYRGPAPTPHYAHAQKLPQRADMEALLKREGLVVCAAVLYKKSMPDGRATYTNIGASSKADGQLQRFCAPADIALRSVPLGDAQLYQLIMKGRDNNYSPLGPITIRSEEAPSILTRVSILEAQGIFFEHYNSQPAIDKSRIRSIQIQANRTVGQLGEEIDGKRPVCAYIWLERAPQPIPRPIK